MRQMMEGVVLRGTGRRPREPERLHLGRQDRIGADLRFQGARLHAPLQREFPGFRAGGESADRDRGDAESGPRAAARVTADRWRLRCSASGHVGAADAGRSQGFAGHESARARIDKRDDNDLAIAGLGSCAAGTCGTSASTFRAVLMSRTTRRLRAGDARSRVCILRHSAAGSGESSASADACGIPGTSRTGGLF